jgi:hypothetical protein
MTLSDKIVDARISGMRFPRLAAFVVPKLMKEFNLTRSQAIHEWELHMERSGGKFSLYLGTE